MKFTILTKETLTNYFDIFESITFALSCRFNGFDNDTNYRIPVTKGKYRSSSGNEIGGRVRLLGKK